MSSHRTPYNQDVRWPLFVVTFLLGAFVVLDGQAPDAKMQAQLRQIFPAATSFSPKGGSPPHFKAFKGEPAAPESLLGYVFWTTELMPLERGYDGPIKMLVGLDTRGVLAGVIVTEHHEPYGRFSVEPPAFAAQFKGKNLRDAFRVGVDIDAVSTATITVTSATRAIRNSCLKIARQFLAPPGTAR